MQSRARRAVFATAVVVLVAVGGAVGLRALYNAAKGHLIGTGCKVADYDLSPPQASVAATMVGVVTSRDLPERAAVLVLAAGLQESKLRNLGPNQGDRDSVGVLQQRPSQGWGSVKQLSDVHYATSAFLDQLVKNPQWQTQPLADAVQAVQISADGSAYAKHEKQAQALAEAFLGERPAALTCSFKKPTKVASVERVAQLLQRDLPVNTPTLGEFTVQVPGASWQTAAWFVANADRLGIDRVAFDGKQWTRAHGWGTAHASPAAVVATMYRL